MSRRGDLVLAGASIDFDVTSAGGKAKIAIDKGAIDLPGCV